MPKTVTNSPQVEARERLEMRMDVRLKGLAEMLAKQENISLARFIEQAVWAAVNEKLWDSREPYSTHYPDGRHYPKTGRVK